MGLENPYHFPPDPPLPHKPNIFYPGFGTGANSYCMADGLERSCREVFRLLDLGLAEQCQNNNCGPQVINHQGREMLIPLSYDKDTGVLGYHPDEWGNTITVESLLPKSLKHVARTVRSPKSQDFRKRPNVHMLTRLSPAFRYGASANSHADGAF
jgi:hypothetical protein